MKNEKELKKLFEGSEETYIIATKNGVGVVGYNSDVLTILTLLIKELRECKGITDEHINKAVKLSKLNEKETMQEVLEHLKSIINKM